MGSVRYCWRMWLFFFTALAAEWQLQGGRVSGSFSSPNIRCRAPILHPALTIDSFQDWNLSNERSPSCNNILRWLGSCFCNTCTTPFISILSGSRPTLPFSACSIFLLPSSSPSNCWTRRLFLSCWPRSCLHLLLMLWKYARSFFLRGCLDLASRLNL